MTPNVLDIDTDLRLVRRDTPPAEALSDPETLWMVDGKREPYTPERLARMYDWLSGRGELRFIEVRDEGTGGAVGARSATSRSAQATSPSSSARRT